MRTQLLCLLSTLILATTALSESSRKICIVGGGPVGLYLAGLLLERHEDVTVLERRERNAAALNSFGIGLSSRLLRSLEQLSPKLRERILSTSARVTIPPISISTRSNLVAQMTHFLEETFPSSNLCFEEGCDSVDFKAQTITTTKGRTISYDVLIGADGVNSRVRRQLIAATGVMEEEHYLFGSVWKALRVPAQPHNVDPGSFRSLEQPSLGGRILPRYPEGHTFLIFYQDTDGTGNPPNVTTKQDLKDVLVEAIQDKPETTTGWLHGTLGRARRESPSGARRELEFDENALDDFLSQARPGRSHHMKIPQFHYGESVALVGDAAHGMGSALGQGCACGLLSAQYLAECLSTRKSLKAYSERAVPGAHAITDLNVITFAFRGGLLTKLLAAPISSLQALRKKQVFARAGNPDVSYEQLHKENRLLLKLAKRVWNKTKLPFVSSTMGETIATKKGNTE